MIYIGIDNGVTGTIAVLGEDASAFIETPVFSCLNYQKSKARNVSRIDTAGLQQWLSAYDPASVRVAIERPMINITRFQASVSAARALEATLIVLERLRFGYEYLDSKMWQKELLPAGIKGAPNLKKASKEVGLRLFPIHSDLIKKHGDADALLIAEWLRRRGT